eukprot:Gb_06811 [translate_table: standard]
MLISKPRAGHAFFLRGGCKPVMLIWGATGHVQVQKNPRGLSVSLPALIDSCKPGILPHGLVLLALSSHLILLKPASCGNESLSCQNASSLEIGAFYLSIYLMALGNGGYHPSIATFGVDQFDEEDQREGVSKIAFFSWFYLALNLGSLFSNTILGYLENNGMWPLGFWLSASAAGMSMVVFLLGTPRYRHQMQGGNPLPRVGQVFVAVIQKWKLKLPLDTDKLYELPSKDSAINGSRKILRSKEFRLVTCEIVLEIQ